MINECLYCERLLYLEWVQGEFADNAFTIEGRLSHSRADRPSGKLPPPAASEPADDQLEEPEAPPFQARSVWLSSERLGITAKIDVVEGTESGSVVPIEYKRGSPPDIPERAYLPERAQLCAHVLLLREHGYRCESAEIYFAGAHQRVPITIDEALIATTLGAVKRARELVEAGRIPPPLVNSPKCNGCSLVGICLPDETNLLQQLELAQAQPVVEAQEAQAEQVMRRLHPARDEKLPLIVQEQGAHVRLDGERVVVTGRDGEKCEAKLPQLSHISLFGNVQITTQTVRAAFDHHVQISYFSTGGWYYGRASGTSSKNIELRLAQYRAATDPAFCLRMARGFVASKIRNCRTMLRRNHEQPDNVTLNELEAMAKKAETAESLDQLLGLEGTAARYYFQSFTGMLRPKDGKNVTLDMHGRNRRPPRDPVNALLSLAYAVLTSDLHRVVERVGFEPLLGFYHQPRFGRPALALDLMEEFRPLVADSAVIGAINTGVVGAEDFEHARGAVSLKAPARRRFLQAYHRRMDQLVTHPVFGYRISYTRVLEVQARLLGRVLLGELEEYPSFRTR